MREVLYSPMKLQVMFSKFLNARSALIIFLILPLLYLLACIIIPLPGGKDKFSDEDISSIVIGVSSEEDILDKFDTPNFSWTINKLDDQEGNFRVFLYQWEKFRGVMAVGAGYSGDIGPVTSDEALLIFLDEPGHVIKVKRATKSPLETYNNFIIRCINSQSNADKSD